MYSTTFFQADQFSYYRKLTKSKKFFFSKYRTGNSIDQNTPQFIRNLQYMFRHCGYTPRKMEIHVCEQPVVRHKTLQLVNVDVSNSLSELHLGEYQGRDNKSGCAFNNMRQ